MEIPIPYNLTEDQLFLEAFPGASMDSEMSWLNDHISWSDEEVMERIFRSTVLLKAKFPDETLGRCLASALIMEIG